MTGDFSFDDKGKVRPKPSQEQAEPQKDTRPLTASDIQGKLDAGTLTKMQQTVGNAAVQRFLAQRSASGQSEVDEETASAISAKRGSGSKLDEGVAAKAGTVMGQDFGSVNVHTDSQADSLSRSLGAKAFTTGNDIFFQEGAYNPSNSEGQRLISHELTHVVQQGASTPSVQGKMTVNDPNDQYEGEADKVADMVMNAPDEAMQREEVPVEEEPPAQLKPDDFLQRGAEEEEMPEAKADPDLQRADEEEMALKPDPTLQRAAPEEEMALKPDPTLQRAAPEEEMSLKPDPDLQRQDDDEMDLKPDPDLQRQDDDELA